MNKQLFIEKSIEFENLKNYYFRFLLHIFIYFLLISKLSLNKFFDWKIEKKKLTNSPLSVICLKALSIGTHGETVVIVSQKFSLKLTITTIIIKICR